MFTSTLLSVTPNTALDNEVVNAGNRLMVSDKIAEQIDKILAKALKDGEAVLQPTPKAVVKPEIAEAISQSKPVATSSKKTTASAKKSSKKTSGQVLKVDKYGNQWIAEYDAKAYSAKKAEMMKAGTYDSSNRSAVYKALGWIL